MASRFIVTYDLLTMSHIQNSRSGLELCADFTVSAAVCRLILVGGGAVWSLLCPNIVYLF